MLESGLTVRCLQTANGPSSVRENGGISHATLTCWRDVRYYRFTDARLYNCGMKTNFHDDNGDNLTTCKLLTKTDFIGVQLFCTAFDLHFCNLRHLLCQKMTLKHPLRCVQNWLWRMTDRYPCKFLESIFTLPLVFKKPPFEKLNGTTENAITQFNGGMDVVKRHVTDL